jgi:hypothetical protein
VALLSPELPQLEDRLRCFRRWSLSGVWDEVVAALRVEVRYSQVASARLMPFDRSSRSFVTVTPRASRRVNRAPIWVGARGYDGAKKVKGRKRVTLCDMAGTSSMLSSCPPMWMSVCAL